MMSKSAGVRGTEQSSTAKLTRSCVNKILCNPCNDTLTDLSKLRKQRNRAILCGGTIGNWVDDCLFPNLW
jgi:hypothetical protein